MSIDVTNPNLIQVMNDALKKVQLGEEVTITDKGRAIAKLVRAAPSGSVLGEYKGK